MDELNQENQDVNMVGSEKDELIIEADAAVEKTVEEEIKNTDPEIVPTGEDLNKPEEKAEPKHENNFYAEENYYDSHPLPQQAPPQYTQPYQQPAQYNQPYQQQPQYRPSYPQPQGYQQSPYQQQPQPYYPQQPQYNGQYAQQPRPQFPPPNSPPQNYNYYTQPAPKAPENNQPEVGGKKKKHFGPIIAIIIAVVLIAGLTCTFIYIANGDKLNNGINSSSKSEANSDSSSDENKVEIPTQSKPDIEEKYMDADGRYTTQGVAKVVSPSVVGVVIYGEGQSLTPISQASGIIISADGYIITNAHVVEGATAQKIILTDGTEYEAKIIGRDSKSDLAVLKIEPKGEIIAAELGNSDELELGEQVMALGNPGGLENSISGGYVSGLDRQIKSSETGLAMSCIQTDAAVNPGNSGGALVNMYGQVVGIISSKYVATGFEGIGFAISINNALPIIQDIIDKGYVSDRIRIGIVFAELTDTTAATYDVVPGLYINEIDPTCDIANSGLQIYDIITEMNGQRVYNYETVMEAIDGLKPGDTVTAKVYRKTIVGEITEFEINFKLMENTTVE